MEREQYDKLKALLEYAVNRRDDVISNGTVHDIVYWNGYIDALNRIERELK